MTSSYLQATLDLLFTDTCVLCQSLTPVRRSTLMCAPCEGSISINRDYCPDCAMPMPDPPTCHHCRNRPSDYEKLVVPLLYDAPVKHMIHRLKFHHGMREGKALAYLFLKQLPAYYSDQAWPERLLPTPMSWRSYVLRGQDQTALICRYLSQELHIPVEQFIGKRHVSPQRTLSRTQRQQLPPDVFYPLRRSIRSPMPGHVAVIDDVMTTGSTARALSRSLRAAGIERVDCWCIARAP